MGRILTTIVQADGSRNLEVWAEKEPDGLHFVCSDDGAWEPEWGCVDLDDAKVRELVRVLNEWLKSRG